MNIYQVYYSNGGWYEDYEQYDILCLDLATAMNFRPEEKDDDLETLYEYHPGDDGYFEVIHEWVWKNNCWEKMK